MPEKVKGLPLNQLLGTKRDPKKPDPKRLASGYAAAKRAASKR